MWDDVRVGRLHEKIFWVYEVVEIYRDKSVST